MECVHWDVGEIKLGIHLKEKHDKNEEREEKRIGKNQSR